jgi:hypothetical protein
MEIIERGSYWEKVIHLFYAKTHALNKTENREAIHAGVGPPTRYWQQTVAALYL